MTRPSSHDVDLDKLPLNPQRWKYILALIIARHNWRHAVRDKGVSHATMADRQQFCFRIFTFLRDNPVRSYRMDPRSFSGRHVDLLMADWRRRAQAGELGAASLQKNDSFLVTFATWIGKPKLVKPLGSYIEDPALITRSYAATEPKGWRARGVDVETVLAQVEAYDRYAAVSLRLMQAFGLRFKEACMLRPHVDVHTAAQAGKADGTIALYLLTHRGTKGGRDRYVPVDTEARKSAIEAAQRMVRREDDSVSDPSLTLVQAIRRLRYVMERFDVTKKALGVVPHGLRHEYAGDGYEDITGSPPPVLGGGKVDPELDRAARREVAARLGHGRPQITTAYLGAVRATAPPFPAPDGSPTAASDRAALG